MAGAPAKQLPAATPGNCDWIVSAESAVWLKPVNYFPKFNLSASSCNSVSQFRNPFHQRLSLLQYSVRATKPRPILPSLQLRLEIQIWKTQELVREGLAKGAQSHTMYVLVCRQYLQRQRLKVCYSVMQCPHPCGLSFSFRRVNAVEMLRIRNSQR